MSKKRKKSVKQKQESKINIDTLLIEGTFFAPSGYSSATREFVHNFIKIYGKNYKNIYLIDRQWDNIRIILSEKYNDTIMKHLVTTNNVIQNVNPDTSMILRWGIPVGFNNEGFENVPHRIKAIYFVWECDRLPRLWIDSLIYYDVIFTASLESAKSIRRSLKENNINIPVEIISHGVSDDYYPIENAKNIMDGFTFMSIGTFSKRKAPFELMKAFLTEFKDEDGVRLLWKIGGIANPRKLLLIKREIQKMAFDLNIDMTYAPKIILDTNTYSRDILNMLYNQVNCLVQVNHGEAWGLPIMNALATGTSVITLDKGGHRAFCNNKNSYFVKNSGLVYSDDRNSWYSIENATKWYDIDMEDYRKILRKVYEDEEGRIEKGKEGIKTAMKYKWENVVKKAYKIFKKYDKYKKSRYDRN